MVNRFASDKLDILLQQVGTVLPRRAAGLKPEQFLVAGTRHPRGVTGLPLKTQGLDQHLLPELNYVLEGEKIVQAGGQCYRLKTGDFYLMPRMVKHLSWPVHAGQSYRLLLFGFQQVQRLWVIYAECTGERQVEQLASIHLKIPAGLVTRFDGLGDDPPEGGGEILGAFFSCLAGAIARQEYFGVPVGTVKRSWKQKSLGQIQDYIGKHLAEKMTLKTIAAHFSMSVRSLVHLFKQEYGDTVFEYIIWQRLARAVGLLRDTRLTVTEIAYRLNYREAYFFSKQFKKFFGITPTECRKRYLWQA